MTVSSKFIFLLVLIIFLLTALIAGLFFRGKNLTSTTLSTPSPTGTFTNNTNAQNMLTTNINQWKNFQNKTSEYSFSYPPELSVSPQTSNIAYIKDAVVLNFNKLDGSEQFMHIELLEGDNAEFNNYYQTLKNKNNNVFYYKYNPDSTNSKMKILFLTIIDNPQVNSQQALQIKKLIDSTMNLNR